MLGRHFVVGAIKTVNMALREKAIYFLKTVEKTFFVWLFLGGRPTSLKPAHGLSDHSGPFHSRTFNFWAPDFRSPVGPAARWVRLRGKKNFISGCGSNQSLLLPQPAGPSQPRPTWNRRAPPALGPHGGSVPAASRLESTDGRPGPALLGPLQRGAFFSFRNEFYFGAKQGDAARWTSVHRAPPRAASSCHIGQPSPAVRCDTGYGGASAPLVFCCIAENRCNEVFSRCNGSERQNVWPGPSGT